MTMGTKLKEERYPITATSVATVVLQFEINRPSHLNVEFFNHGSEQFIPQPPVQGATVRMWVEVWDGAAWQALDAASVFQDVVPLGKQYVDGPVNQDGSQDRQIFRVRAQRTAGALGGFVDVLLKVDPSTDIVTI